MTTARQFGREASIYVLGFAVVGMLQFLALPVYSRVLGPAQFGLYSVTLAATTALAAIMVVGGDVTLARFWADQRTDEDRRRLASTWIAFLSVWSVVISGVAAAAAPLISWPDDYPSDFAGLFILGIAALVPAQLSRMLAQVLRNSFRSVAYASLLALGAAFDVGLGLLFVVWAGWGVHGILLGILIGQTIAALVTLPLVRAYVGFSFDRSVLPPLLRFGVPFIPASLAVWAMKSLDRLVLSTNAAPEEVGYYGFAVSLIAPFSVITMALGQAWIPRIAQLDARDRLAAARGASAAIAWATAGFGAAAMLVGALAPVIVRVLGGAAFTDSAQVMPLLALGAALTGVAVFARTGLTLTRRTTIIPVVTGIAALLDAALLLVLVPRVGLVGAAAASAAAYCTLSLLTLWAGNRVYPLDLPVSRLLVMLLALTVQTCVATANPGAATVWGITVVCLVVLGAQLRRMPAPKGGTSTAADDGDPADQSP
jgi:O-antigen/teichoic acid export membrane protein